MRYTLAQFINALGDRALTAQVVFGVGGEERGTVDYKLVASVIFSEVEGLVGLGEELIGRSFDRLLDGGSDCII